MYYRINDEDNRIINFQGFEFILRVRKSSQFEVIVTIETFEQEIINEVSITDEEIGINQARESLEQSVFEWLEENTDTADRVISTVMQW